MAASFLHLDSALISFNQRLSLSTIAKIELYQSLARYSSPSFLRVLFTTSYILGGGGERKMTKSEHRDFEGLFTTVSPGARKSLAHSRCSIYISLIEE